MSDPAREEPCPDCGCLGDKYDGHVCEDYVMDCGDKALAVQLAWETAVALAGAALLVLGGLRDDWPVFGIGFVLVFVEIFRLGSGQWLDPVRRAT